MGGTGDGGSIRETSFALGIDIRTAAQDAAGGAPVLTLEGMALFGGIAVIAEADHLDPANQNA